MGDMNMSNEELIELLLAARVIRVGETYDFVGDEVVERLVVKDAGCGCCAEEATLPSDVAATILAIDAEQRS